MAIVGGSRRQHAPPRRKGGWALASFRTSGSWAAILIYLLLSMIITVARVDRFGHI
jgi:hypothetical protein